MMKTKAESSTPSISDDRFLSSVRAGLCGFARDLEGYRIILFGSRARGTHRPRSDYDLGIVGDRPVSLQTYHRIGDWLEELPTLRRIDWVDLTRSAIRLREEAIKHGEVLYG